jgi:uncharacterized membrane protein YdfJ with MMPL/SSD domain
MMERRGRFVARRAWVVLAAVGVTLLAGVYGASVFDSLSNGGFDDPNSEGAHELRQESQFFGSRAPYIVVAYSTNWWAPAPLVRCTRRGLESVSAVARGAS